MSDTTLEVVTLEEFTRLLELYGKLPVDVLMKRYDDAIAHAARLEQEKADQQREIEKLIALVDGYRQLVTLKTDECGQQQKRVAELEAVVREQASIIRRRALLPTPGACVFEPPSAAIMDFGVIPTCVKCGLDRDHHATPGAE